MKSMFTALLGVAVAAGSACAQESTGTAPLSDDVLEAAASITPDDYLRKISVIAHDSMGGATRPAPDST